MFYSLLATRSINPLLGGFLLRAKKTLVHGGLIIGSRQG